jgi:hypothetical protein
MAESMADEMKVTKRSGPTVREETRTLAVQRRRTDGFQSVYADNVQVSVNYFGISMLLGEVEEVGQQAIKVCDRVMVHMSPEQAGALHKLLGVQIEKYCENFGQLRPAPEGDGKENSARKTPE